jgi:hypothetical protein
LNTLDLDRKRHGFTSRLSDNVVIEEITVDCGLDGTSNPDNPIPVTNFSEEPVYPVDQIHSTVSSQTEHVVRGKILDETARFLGELMDDNQLRDNGNSFQINGECPENLSKRKVFVDKESQNSTGNQEVRKEEGIILLVVCITVRGFEFHQIDD